MDSSEDHGTVDKPSLEQQFNSATRSFSMQAYWQTKNNVKFTNI